MFLNRIKEGTPANQAISLIGAGVELTGNIEASSVIHIDGVVLGNIRVLAESAAGVVIGPRARVQGSITAHRLTIDGTVSGPVFCIGYLELKSGARITGDVDYVSLVMRPGAVVNGRLTPREKVTDISAYESKPGSAGSA